MACSWAWLLSHAAVVWYTTVVGLVHDMSAAVPVSCKVSMHLHSIIACRKVVSTLSAALEVFATSKNLKATLWPMDSRVFTKVQAEQECCHPKFLAIYSSTGFDVQCVQTSL